MLSGRWAWQETPKSAQECMSCYTGTHLFIILEFYKDKRVIITGASRGIGKELAIQLSQLGAKYVAA